ncbi:putative ribonuclease H-like domain-containing protein [Tanacetum coccineum]
MKEELLQFKLQEVWTLVDLPNGKRAIGTKWVYRNKKDERGIVIKNKARLVAQRYIQEEGIDYDEVFSPVARIEAIRLFLAYASFKDFVVYQMDVKSAFLYGNIEDQDKYVTKILKKFGLTDVKTASTPMETQKALLKDEDGEECVPVQDTNYTDSDYDGASLDRKSTTGVLECLISEVLIKGRMFGMEWKTLIEAARTMLADSKLPTTFWAKAVNTACYVKNRVLVIKPHNKTPYELFLGRKPALSFMRPFGCPVTILNTIDHLGKFDGKAHEGFFIGYSTNSKAFRVFNSRTRIVEENLHVQFSGNTPNIARNGPNWPFYIDALTNSMNYKAVVAGNQSNGSAGTKACDDAGKAKVEIVPGKDYILLPLWTQDPPFFSCSKDSPDVGFKPSGEEEKKDAEDPVIEGGNPSEESERVDQEKDANVNNTNNINTVSPTVSADGIEDNVVDENIVYGCVDDPNMPDLEEISRFKLPNGKRAIRTKWVFRNKKDERGIVIKNKAILVAQGYTQEEGIDYDKVFAPVARIKAIKLFLAYASFKDFVVYQMEVKSAFLYRKIKEEVYRGKIDKTLFIRRVKSDILLVQVYVDDIIFGSTKKSLCIEFEKIMHKKFQMSSMGELTFFLGLQVKQKNNGIFISQDKYVTEILKKFGFSDVKTASTPMETHKPLLKDADGEDVDEHLYRSMIGSLMYLTSSRPDIMFAVCVCARFQVNPKVSHLYAVKRIFRYLKGQPKLGLWYPKDSPFDLAAYTNSDYERASLDRKSTTGGCLFLGCRLIS